MQKVVLLFIFFVSTGLNASVCTDFSGEYKSPGSYQKIDLKISQEQCESIELNYVGRRQSISYVFDGQKVLTYEDPSLGLTQYSTPIIRTDDIIIEIENHWIDNGQIDRFKKRFVLDYSHGQATLLIQLGDFRSDGVFVPQSSESYLKQ